MDDFIAGSRIVNIGNPVFPDYSTGTIRMPESFQLSLAKKDEWQGYRRVVQTLKGKIVFYFVEFDEPQDDGSGDGPYRGSEVEAEYLFYAKE